MRQMELFDGNKKEKNDIFQINGLPDLPSLADFMRTTAYGEIKNNFKCCFADENNNLNQVCQNVFLKMQDMVGGICCKYIRQNSKLRQLTPPEKNMLMEKIVSSSTRWIAAVFDQILLDVQNEEGPIEGDPDKYFRRLKKLIEKYGPNAKVAILQNEINKRVTIVAGDANMPEVCPACERTLGSTPGCCTIN